MSLPARSSSLARVADRFIPPPVHAGPPDDLRKLRIAVLGCLFLLVLPLIPATAAFLAGSRLFLFPLVAPLFGLTGLWLARSGRSAHVIAAWLTSVMGCTLGSFAWFMNGIAAPTAPSLLLVAPIGFLLSGRRLGVTAAVLVAGLFIALAVKSDDPIRLMRVGALLSAHLMLSLLVNALNSLHAAAFGTAVQANRALSRANDELEGARAGLERALQARSRLLAVVSHEVRNPLNGIMGVAQLMRTSATIDEQREYAKILHTSSEAVLSIVNGLLDHAKIESGKMQLERIALSIPAVVEQTRRLHLIKTQDKGLQFSCDVHPALAQPVIGDPVRLSQILMNLLGNAIKFTDRGSVVLRVAPDAPESSEPAEARVRFEVIDTGIGMTADQCQAIFTEFAQATTATTRLYGGTGLGLTICKELVDLMGGEIGVTSTPGVGTTFWFAIPLPGADRSGSVRLDSADSADTSEIAGATPPGSVAESNQRDSQSVARRTVLVVEDNAINQKVTVAMLRALGLHADVATNGHEALQALAEHRYDVVLMDCHMPVMDGFQATQAIREREADGPRTPIIALTGAATERDHRACLNAGMDDCLVKPIARDALKTVLDSWFQTR